MSDISIGTGVTENAGSDRHPYIVTCVLSPRRIVIQNVDAKRVDNNGYGGKQVWEYTFVNTNPTKIITKRKNGRWCAEGESMKSFSYTIGHMDKYCDPSL